MGIAFMGTTNGLCLHSANRSDGLLILPRHYPLLQEELASRELQLQ